MQKTRAPNGLQDVGRKPDEETQRKSLIVATLSQFRSMKYKNQSIERPVGIPTRVSMYVCMYV